jgi:hypothetical protein
VVFNDKGRVMDMNIHHKALRNTAAALAVMHQKPVQGVALRNDSIDCSAMHMALNKSALPSVHHMSNFTKPWPSLV